MRVCQEKINIVTQTKLESVVDTMNRNKGSARKRINIEAQTKLESVVDTMNRSKGSVRKRLISRHKLN